LNTDGTQVAFHSDADFLGEGIQEDQYEIWHYDVPTAQLTRITRSPLEDRSSTAAYISGDGMRIAFQSDVDFHDEGILLGQTEVWFYELEQRALWRVTYASGEGRDSFIKGISANGRLVLLDGDSDFNGEGLADNRFEIWLYSVDEEGMRRLSLASDENRDSVWGTVSDAGVVVFASDSDMLGEGIEDNQSELWLWQGDE